MNVLIVLGIGLIATGIIFHFQGQKPKKWQKCPKCKAESNYLVVGNLCQSCAEEAEDEKTRRFHL